MSQTTIKDELLQQAYSIQPSAIKRLDIPYDTFLQECSQFILWAKHDMEQLQITGFQCEIIDEAEILLLEAQTQHTLWVNESKLTRKEVSNWNVLKKEAITVGKQLIHQFKYAFRNDKELLAAISKAKIPCKGQNLASHLGLLVFIGNKNQNLLKDIKFDFSLLSQANNLAKELSNALANKNSVCKIHTHKNKRDQIFHMFKN